MCAANCKILNKPPQTVNTSGKIPPCNPQNMKVKDWTVSAAGTNNNHRSLNNQKCLERLMTVWKLHCQFEQPEVMPKHMCKYVDYMAQLPCWSLRGFTGVAPHVNQRNPLHSGNEACKQWIYPDCKAQDRSHQKSNTWISVFPRKD